jgi:transmembrane sensor
MNPPSAAPRFDVPEPVLREAGAWLARRDRGFTAAESADYRRWLESHPQHPAAVAHLEQVMQVFDRLPALAPDAARSGRPNADFFAPRPTGRVRRYATVGALGLAAALALMFSWPEREPSPAPQRLAATTVAESITLPDGSAVKLNRETELEVDFSPGVRRLRLKRGEAHFAVAKDPSRPFIVTADQVAARAVGTAFNVRLGADRVEVLVTAGQVQVGPAAPVSGHSDPTPISDAPGATSALLESGFVAVMARATPAAKPSVTRLAADEVARQLAWQPVLIDLSNAPLVEVVAEFNRRATAPGTPRLVLGDASLADLRIGGSVHANQPEPFVRLLEKSFGIRADREGDTLTLRRAP